MYQNKLYSDGFTSHFQDGQLAGHVDLPRLKAGKVGGSFWSAWTPCPEDGLDFSDGNYAQSESWSFQELGWLLAYLGFSARFPTCMLHIMSSQSHCDGSEEVASGLILASCGYDILASGSNTTLDRGLSLRLPIAASE